MRFSLGKRHRAVGAIAVIAAGMFLLAGARTCRAALSFDFNPVAGTPQQVIDGFDAAGLLWSTLLEDDVTVRISVSYVNIPTPGVLAFASGTDFTASYSAVHAALDADSTTPDDASTAAHLLPGGNFSMWTNYTSNNPHGEGSPLGYLDNTGLNTSTIRLPRANAKALGLVPGSSGVSDGSITFDSGANWDFDRGNGILFGSNDFVGAAAHEIGHLLGFTSGVDALDQNSPGPGGLFRNDNSLREVTVADLFRFSLPSVAQGTGVIDWRAGTADKYFSVDGGQTKLVSFATGEVHGDGQQASHWKDNRGIGLMDPSLAPRELGAISENDVRMFDVIGWDRNFTKTWQATDGGQFADIRNWIGGVPETTHTALFDVSGVFLVTFNGADAFSNRLLVTDGDVNFNLGGATYSVTNPGDAIVVADRAGQNAALAVRSGSLSASSAVIARVAGSRGQVTVSGASARWALSGDLHVGGDASGAGGDATLTVRTFATVAVDGTLRAWDTSTVELDGGAVDAQRFQLDGLLTGKGQISGPADRPTMLISAGRIEPGPTFGTISIHGDYDQTAAGSLVVDIGGLVPGTQFDQLQVLGTATLAGLLEVTLSDGFQPSSGDRFDLLSYAERVGMFETLTLPPLPAGLVWRANYAADGFSLSALDPQLGDTDLDGDVDIADLNNVRNHFGATGMPVPGDTNGDGLVDIVDLNNVRNNFGAVAVPEPASAGLAICGGGVLLIRRRRRGTRNRESVQ